MMQSQQQQQQQQAPAAQPSAQQVLQDAESKQGMASHSAPEAPADKVASNTLQDVPEEAEKGVSEYVKSLAELGMLAVLEQPGPDGQPMKNSLTPEQRMELEQCARNQKIGSEMQELYSNKIEKLRDETKDVFDKAEELRLAATEAGVELNPDTVHLISLSKEKVSNLVNQMTENTNNPVSAYNQHKRDIVDTMNNVKRKVDEISKQVEERKKASQESAPPATQPMASQQPQGGPFYPPPWMFPPNAFPAQHQAMGTAHNQQPVSNHEENRQRVHEIRQQMGINPTPQQQQQQQQPGSFFRPIDPEQRSQYMQMLQGSVPRKREAEPAEPVEEPATKRANVSTSAQQPAPTAVATAHSADQQPAEPMPREALDNAFNAIVQCGGFNGYMQRYGKYVEEQMGTAHAANGKPAGLANPLQVITEYYRNGPRIDYSDPKITMEMERTQNPL